MLHSGGVSASPKVHPWLRVRPLMIARRYM